jgi:hypothetical protein
MNSSKTIGQKDIKTAKKKAGQHKLNICFLVYSLHVVWITEKKNSLKIV